MEFLSGIPLDVLRSCAIITVMGNHQLYIENFKSILEYNEETIKMRTLDGVILATGKNLKVQYYNREEIKITGSISEIRFGV